MDPTRLGYKDVSDTTQNQFKEFLEHVIKEFDKRIETISVNSMISVTLVSNNNDHLFVGTNKGLIQVYKVFGNENYPFQGHTGKINCLCNVNHHTFASGGDDKKIILWNYETRKKISVFNGSSENILALAADDNQKIIVSGGREGGVRIWDLENGSLKQELKYHKGFIKGICFAKNADWLITAASDNKIAVWLVENFVLRLELHQDSKITSIAYCPSRESEETDYNEFILASGGEDKILRLWNLKDGSHKKLQKHKKPILSMCNIENSNYIAIGCEENGKGVLYIWDSSLGKLESHFKLKSVPKFLCSSIDGKYLYSGGTDKVVLKIRLVEDIERRNGLIVHSSLLGDYRINGLVMSPDDSSMYSIGEDSALKMYSFKSETQIELKKYEGKPKSIAISPSGALIAIGNEFSTIKIFDRILSKEIRNLAEHRLPVTALDFSRNELMLASIGNDRVSSELIIWNLSTYSPLKFYTSPKEIKALSFSGLDYVIYATDDTLHVVSCVNSAQIRVLKGFALNITYLALSHSGSQLISLGGNGMVDVWDLDFFTLIASLTAVEETPTQEISEIGLQFLNTRESIKPKAKGMTRAPLLVCACITNCDNYLIIATKYEELQFWSLRDKARLGSYKLNLPIKSLLLDSSCDIIYLVSDNQVISLKNPATSKTSDIHVFGPSQYSVFYVAYFKQFWSEDFEGDYPAHLND